jgi:hypothetical protein
MLERVGSCFMLLLAEAFFNGVSRHHLATWLDVYSLPFCCEKWHTYGVDEFPWSIRKGRWN